MNRLLNMPMRRLTDSEKKWLENRVHDSRPEVAELARSVYNMHFPHAERNAMKKQLHINALTFEIYGEVYDGYGDYEMVNRRFMVDRKECTIVYADLDNDGQEQTVTLEQNKVFKLLKWMVHSLEIFMWEQDYCGTSYSDDVGIDCLEDDDDGEDISVDFDLAHFENSISLPVEPTDEIPTWSVHAEYSNHTVQDTTCYDGNVSDRVDELYWKLLDYFEPAEDDFDEDFND